MISNEYNTRALDYIIYCSVVGKYGTNTVSQQQSHPTVHDEEGIHNRFLKSQTNPMDSKRKT